MKFGQTATYWEVGEAGLSGEKFYLPPRRIKVRWEDVVELFITPAGEEVASQAKVYMSEVPTIESYLVLGCSNSADPERVPGAMRIKSRRIITSIKNTKRTINCWL